jgi:hypothetical protein
MFHGRGLGSEHPQCDIFQAMFLYFRMIEKWHGTIISDEADISKSDETEAFPLLVTHLAAITP